MALLQRMVSRSFVIQCVSIQMVSCLANMLNKMHLFCLPSNYISCGCPSQAKTIKNKESQHLVSLPAVTVIA